MGIPGILLVKIKTKGAVIEVEMCREMTAIRSQENPSHRVSRPKTVVIAITIVIIPTVDLVLVVEDEEETDHQ